MAVIKVEARSGYWLKRRQNAVFIDERHNLEVKK